MLKLELIGQALKREKQLHKTSQFKKKKKNQRAWFCIKFRTENNTQIKALNQAQNTQKTLAII